MKAVKFLVVICLLTVLFHKEAKSLPIVIWGKGGVVMNGTPGLPHICPEWCWLCVCATANIDIIGIIFDSKGTNPKVNDYLPVESVVDIYDEAGNVISTQKFLLKSIDTSITPSKKNGVTGLPGNAFVFETLSK